MVATLKLSGIASSSSNFAAGDQLVGVRSGPTDNLFSYTQVFGSVRTRQTADGFYYVNASTGNDSTGNGTLASPWATIQHAYDYIRANIDGGGFDAYIMIAAGSYTDMLMRDGFVGLRALQFQGVKNSASSVVVNGFGNAFEGFYVHQPIIYFSDLTAGYLNLTGFIHARWGTADFGGANVISSRTLIWQGVSTGETLHLNGAGVILEDFGASTTWDCTLTPNVRGFLDIDGAAWCNFQSIVSVLGTPAMSDGFFKISGDAQVEYNDAGITGTATGKRFSLFSGGQLRMFGAAETVLPGSIAGAIDSGGCLQTTSSDSRYQFDSFSMGGPVTITTDHTVGTAESWIINNKPTTTCTLTLPTPATYFGRILNVLNYQGQTVVSASSNVVSITGGAAGTAILAGTAGKWVTLVCDGTNWITTQGN